jgi:hypothetical protein
MYSVPDFALIEHPIHRYSIGDRTSGVLLDDDGALTITISHQRPDDERTAANWLPSPAGDFRPVLRMYEPEPSVLDPTYEFRPSPGRDVVVPSGRSGPLGTADPIARSG